MTPLFRVIVLASCVFSCAHAAFLPETAFDFRTVVPPPPARGTIAEEVDLTSATLFTRNRTPEQLAMALRYEKIDIYKMMRAVVGDWATEQNLPRLARFLKDVLPEVVPITEAAKNAYARPRPHETNPTLSLAYAKKPDGYSYPSGHGTASGMYAVILTALLPEHAADWERETPLSTSAVRLIQAMANDQTVEGFEVRQSPNPPARVGDLEVQLIADYRGASLAGKVIRIANRGSRSVRLAERDIAPADTLAVTIVNPVLGPGGSTTAFIVGTNGGSEQ